MVALRRQVIATCAERLSNVRMDDSQAGRLGTELGQRLRGHPGEHSRPLGVSGVCLATDRARRQVVAFARRSLSSNPIRSMSG